MFQITDERANGVVFIKPSTKRRHTVLSMRKTDDAMSCDCCNSGRLPSLSDRWYQLPCHAPHKRHGRFGLQVDSMPRIVSETPIWGVISLLKKTSSSNICFFI